MKIKRVLILLGYVNYETYQGMLTYAKQHHWQVDNDNFYTRVFPKVDPTPYDGVLSIHGMNPLVIDWIESKTIPIVDCGQKLELDYHHVGYDNKEVGVKVAKHLIHSGFNNFSFLINKDKHTFDQKREQGFEETVKSAGKKFKLLEVPEEESVDEFLLENLSKLKVPTALMTAHDLNTAKVVNCAMKLGINVPDELAVIGVKMDDDLHQLSPISLSHIDNNAFKVGYTAAQMLDQLMDEEEDVPKEKYIEPGAIYERASSNIVAIKHKEVRRALNYIDKYYDNFINVNDVLANSHITPAALHRAFKRLLGHSILDEITRRRVDKAIELLETTTIKVQEIAAICGFSSSLRMGQVFKRKCNKNPLKFRKDKELYSV